MATWKQPGTKYDLEKLHQTSRESLRNFIRCFSETRNSVPNISDAEASPYSPKGYNMNNSVESCTSRGPRPSVN
jgi:hypothetical protein